MRILSKIYRLTFFHMNIKRAVVFGVFVYLASLLLYGVLWLRQGLPVATGTIPFGAYIFMWIVYIPIIFAFAKWYFKQVTPTVRRGFALGAIALCVAFVIDAVGFLGATVMQIDTGLYQEIYRDRNFWLTVLWILILCAIAGGEFDATFSRWMRAKNKA